MRTPIHLCNDDQLSSTGLLSRSIGKMAGAPVVTVQILNHDRMAFSPHASKGRIPVASDHQQGAGDSYSLSPCTDPAYPTNEMLTDPSARFSSLINTFAILVFFRVRLYIEPLLPF